ncbi:MAG: hypothetical protein V4553_21745 [Bacteroidota bacterium]
MKQFFSYLFALCALACLAFSIYKAIPIFPYIKDAEVLASFGAFLLFYYLAYRTSSSRKENKKIA